MLHHKVAVFLRCRVPHRRHTLPQVSGARGARVDRGERECPFEDGVFICQLREPFHRIALLMLSHDIDGAQHHSSPTGISRKACPRVSISPNGTPRGTPSPTISPRSLMWSAETRSKAELAG